MCIESIFPCRMVPLSILLMGLLGFIRHTSAQTLDTMVNNGPTANRVNMVFIGDGYQAHELNTVYVDHIQATLGYLFNHPLSEPFGRYQNYFNVHRVNIASIQSGADDPINGIFVNTALDASFNWGNSGIDRLLYFSNAKANAALNAAISGTGIDVDMRFGTVNVSKYGGGGRQWAVYAGGNSFASELALHEVGHSYANLADEYFSPGTWSGGEFSRWNVTNNPNSGKWDRWLGYDDPDTDIGPVDYYQGGNYHQNGVWRPSLNSKMRSLDRPFDAISREKFIWDIYQKVRPLDDWLDNSEVLIDPGSIWMQSVDSDLITIQWYLDGFLSDASGEVFDVSSLNLAPGDYELVGMAYDSLLDFSFQGGSLDWWRLDPGLLQQSVSWQFSITTVPEPSSGLFVLTIVGCLLFQRSLRIIPLPFDHDSSDRGQGNRRGELISYPQAPQRSGTR